MSMSSEFTAIAKRSAFWAFVFFVTLVGLSSAYAALTAGLSTSDRAAATNPLSSASWNRVVDSVLELDQRTGPLQNSGGKIGIGATPSPSFRVTVGWGLFATWASFDTEVGGLWAIQMAATSACVAKSANGWVAAFKRGSASTCNARCAASGGAYYLNCRWMVSSRGYGEQQGVNAIDWWGSTGCSTATYPNYDEFYCCCSY